MRTVNDVLNEIERLSFKCRNLEFDIKIKSKINKLNVIDGLKEELQKTRLELNKLLSLEIKE